MSGQEVECADVEAEGPYAGQFTWRHILYRAYGSGRKLLYIGMTTNIYTRFSEHRGLQRSWWPQVVDVTIEFHPDRRSLRAAEKAAIVAEKPIYNIKDNPAALPWWEQPRWAAYHEWAAGNGRTDLHDTPGGTP